MSYSVNVSSTENLHTISVQDMGNYQEYLKKLPQPLREIETLPVRQHTFGNPFKVNKVSDVSSLLSVITSSLNYLLELVTFLSGQFLQS